MMRYVPATVAAIGICAVTAFALCVTKDGYCLFGLCALAIVWFLIPD